MHELRRRIMSSIVLDLQEEAINSDVELSELLRKAYFVAKKLKVEDFEKWINSELNGYNDGGIPNYRKIHGEPKYFNQFYGYQDFLIDDSDLYESLSNNKLSQPISELEDLYIQSKGKPLHFKINPQIILGLMKLFNMDQGPEVLFISPSALKGIFNSVRQIILDWTLKLEEDGILGENLTFTQEEKEIALKETVNYNTIINNSQLQFGEGNIQNINQVNLEEVNVLLKSIKDSINELKLNVNNGNELNVGIKTIESQLCSQKPNQTIIKESLKSIRHIVEGCVTNAIAPVLIAAISKIIGF